METVLPQTFCQCGAAVCSEPCFRNRLSEPSCSRAASVSELKLQTHSIDFCLSMCSVFVLQGSYGVVKLAYNEDDDKHYVSYLVGTCFTVSILQAFIEPLSVCCLHRGPVLLILLFLFSLLWISSLKLHQLLWKKLGSESGSAAI